MSSSVRSRGGLGRRWRRHGALCARIRAQISQSERLGLCVILCERSMGEGGLPGSAGATTGADVGT
eukprot:7512622-Pyramimonas_sp.AAC.1